MHIFIMKIVIYRYIWLFEGISLNYIQDYTSGPFKNLLHDFLHDKQI